jgi:hypothetical protein
MILRLATTSITVLCQRPAKTNCRIGCGFYEYAIHVVMVLFLLVWCLCNSNALMVLPLASDTFPVICRVFWAKEAAFKNKVETTLNRIRLSMT